MWRLAGVLGILATGMAAAPADAAKRRAIDLQIGLMSGFGIEAGDQRVHDRQPTGLAPAGENKLLPEILVTHKNVGLSLRQEGRSVKPDLFFSLAGWQLRTRILQGDSPLEVDGMLVRASHAFPLFPASRGAADLP